MKFSEFAINLGEWLRGNGPESDIVISSRIRLARNLGDFAFIKRCTDIDKANIESRVRDRINEHEHLAETFYIDVADLEKLDRQMLVERQLISREHADAEGARAVAIDPQEMFSVMINEEDHLRIQVMKSGLDLDTAWSQINEMDNALGATIRYAYDERLGFLTACPTNVGTGMRVSVMLHLPALGFTKQIDKVFRSLQKINLAVRGLYGESSQPMGDFYQISNQITLGKSEQELINDVAEVVPVLIGYERKAREYLIAECESDLRFKVIRAIESLQNAEQISSEETMHLLSRVRMGVNLHLIEDVDIPTVNKLFIHTQPAHLQIINGSKLATTDRNVERAVYLQKFLNSPPDRPSAEDN